MTKICTRCGQELVATRDGYRHIATLKAACPLPPTTDSGVCT